MDLLDKLRAVEKRSAMFADGSAMPGLTVIERVLGPCEVVVRGRPTLMFGSNNYLGLTLHPEVIEAARGAVVEYGTGTTGSRTANGTLAIHEELERDLADWFGKRHAIIFSTGYQANLSLIGGLCGAGDVILIDSDSHASIYDATRQTAAQVIGFRHNSAESLRKKLERLPAHGRNRLVVVEGLYSIRGDAGLLAAIRCRAEIESVRQGLDPNRVRSLLENSDSLIEIHLHGAVRRDHIRAVLMTRSDLTHLWDLAQRWKTCHSRSVEEFAVVPSFLKMVNLLQRYQLPLQMAESS